MPATTLIAAGHTDSVLCCEALPARKLLASGGEDGVLCLTDLAALKPVGRLNLRPLGDAVPALCAHPQEDHTLFAAAGAAVLQLDLRRGLGAAAAVRCFGANADEVNSLAASAANGGWLAAGDDAGEVQVISLSPSSSSGSSGDGGEEQNAAAAPAGSSGGSGSAAAGLAGGAAALPRPERPAAFKTLRRGHSNICAAVAFRPHRPWELLSGGLDSTIVRWDFSRLRPLQSWSLAGEATAGGGQVFNPPMVHCLAVPASEDRGLGRLMAAGRGDGCVALYDADCKPAAAPAGGGSSGGGKRGGGKAGARQRGGSGRQQAAAGSAAAGAVPGRLALLGGEQGGHTAAVNSVAFFGPGCQQLLSAGNDCRLLLWNWGAAQEAAAASSQARAELDADGEAAAEPGGGAGSLRSGGEQQPGSSPAAGATGAGADEAEDSRQQLLAVEHRHARKINWACPADVPGCSYNVILADTGRRLTALALA